MICCLGRRILGFRIVCGMEAAVGLELLLGSSLRFPRPSPASRVTTLSSLFGDTAAWLEMEVSVPGVQVWCRGL